jgi:hypothetical protein
MTDRQHGADVNRQHTSTQNVNYGTDLSNTVTISKAEHEYMVRLTLPIAERSDPSFQLLAP